ncbi:hypothetical protein IX39_20350 [Chryseobacterium formosense]|uniref:SMODS and SLOG-associating 2TM effector domain-containing protein n=1 Tax=Chryseobacterium formosense TaxID=236814 RepID=A0A085YYT5_9FLAO|nr:DUF4231 domain-containing protein [Chryseobacterium formosense]KFE97348.1 hypothetical protein IX39_20350 [Chryseobacterium formosense]SFT91320.1 Protein of unknown function [Chryseobacterium formosense]
MKEKDFPNYYIAGDQASLLAQKLYTRYVRLDLFLMVLSATLTIYNFQPEESKKIIYIISGIVMLIAILFSLIIKNKKYEDIWYRGRALAESVKTLTWRFMTKSEYFENSITNEEAKLRFTNRMKELNEEFKDLHSSLQAKYLSLPIITYEMEKIRNLNLSVRREFYLKNRIDNQIKWYSDKADSNKTKYESWFLGVIAMQLLALISIAYLILSPESNFNFVGLFTTLSASFFGWLQLKKYQENKEAYTTATSELNLIKQEAEFIDNEEKFKIFVLDSENAMSREHTLWLAQKRF